MYRRSCRRWPRTSIYLECIIQFGITAAERVSSVVGEVPSQPGLRCSSRGRGTCFDSPEACGSRTHLADPGRGGRQPEPGCRQRRPALDRRGVRLLADHAQPDRSRLLARSRRVGALPRRARRPLRAQADAGPRHGARDPRVLPRCLGAERRGPLRGPRHGRPRCRHGLPDHARPDHRALVRAGANEVDRALVGARRRHLRARPAALGPAPGALLVGVGLPVDVAARRGGAGAGLPLRPEPRQRGDRSSRQPRRHPLGGAGWGADPVDQLRARPEQGNTRARAGGNRRRRADRVLHPPASGEEPALRSRRRRTTALSGSPPAPGSSSSAR